VGFEIVCDLFFNLLFKDRRKAGQDRCRSVTVGSRVSPPLKRGMTLAAFQPLEISDDTKERLNRLVIGVATIAVDHFRKRGSRLSSPADL
jgi:hypothetical protein